jgi:hypothetical protein
MKNVKKTPIDPQRIRSIPPEGFSWIDRRFVREGFIESLGREAGFLYFFLIAVSDAHGISFYADPTIGKLLKLTCEQLTQARAQMIDQGLILYRHPLYQVLSLPKQPKRTPGNKPPKTPNQAPSRDENAVSLKEFLQLKSRNRSKGEDARHGKEKTRPIETRLYTQRWRRPLPVSP